MNENTDPLRDFLRQLLPPSYHDGRELVPEEKHAQSWEEDREFFQLANPNETYQTYRERRRPEALRQHEQLWPELARNIVLQHGPSISGVETIPIIPVGRKLLNATAYTTESGERAIAYEQGFGAGFLRIDVFIAKWSHGMATGTPDPEDLFNAMRYILKYGRIAHPWTDLNLNIMPAGLPELKLLATQQSIYQVLFALLHEFGHLYAAEDADYQPGEDPSSEEFRADEFALKLLLKCGDPLSAIGVPAPPLEGLGGPNWNDMNMMWFLWSQAILWNVLHIIETLSGPSNSRGHPSARERWAKIKAFYSPRVLSDHADYVEEIADLSDDICDMLIGAKNDRTK